FITNGELYIELGWQPGNQVFLTADLEGQTHPMAWTRTYGNGKVFQTTLGHDGLSFQTTLFQQLVVNAVDWVTS
ncbi:MAG: ThuA domain-containing protein, partial [Chloroflexi bacterium]|nr:ThuA domain-containing protein [Chloroflexota bacterium]